jgi:hypothetical protein
VRALVDQIEAEEAAPQGAARLFAASPWRVSPRRDRPVRGCASPRAPPVDAGAPATETK